VVQRTVKKYLEHKQNVDDVTDTRFGDIARILVGNPERYDWECLKELGEPSVKWEAWDEFVREEDDEGNVVRIWRDEMTIADARAFKQQLEDAGLGSRTVEGNLRIVQSF